jgi:RimJ/RimL family protein N-acetyltransferase
VSAEAWEPPVAGERSGAGSGEIGTLRLLLRPVDADAALAVLAGRVPDGLELAPGYPSPFSLDLLALAARGSSPQDVGPFFVVRRADHALVGEIGCRIDGVTGTAHVGYTIAEPCWNLGYATEALRALLRHLFEEVGVPRVAAETEIGNGASRRVLEKAGLRAVSGPERRRADAPLEARRSLPALVRYEAVAGSWSLSLPFSTRTRGTSRRSRSRRSRPLVG